MTRLKYGSDKEVQAVTVNIKEDRILEKTMQTLRLEEDYAMKLLELDSREVKINNRRLKNRVARIKSHLTAADILELRALELEGKLKPLCTGVSVNGATRIAAAARRLGLNTRSEADGDELPMPIVATSERPAMIRTVAAIAVCTRNSISSPPPSTERAVSTPCRNAPRVRPATSVVRSSEPFKAPPRARTSMGYSSHDTGSQRELPVRRPIPISTRRLSMVSTSSIGSNYAKNMIEERRQELLENEQARTAQLRIRQEDFLAKVQRWVEENPSRTAEGDIPSTRAHQERRKTVPNTRVLFRTKTAETPLNVEASWKDLNKCRYLRISEEMVDLSGVVTLAKDQMKLFQSLKQPHAYHSYTQPDYGEVAEWPEPFCGSVFHFVA